MDPKRAQEIRNGIDAVVGPLNVYALACYAQLLQTCGVRQINVFRVFMLP